MLQLDSIRRLSKFLSGYKKETFLGPICKFVEAVLELIIPILMSNIIDYGIKNRNINYVIQMGGIMVLLSLVGLFFALVCQYLASRASQGFGTKLRSALFSHVNSFSFRELDLFAPHVITTRITNDVNQLQIALALAIRLVTRSPFLIIGAMFMSVIISKKLSIVLFIMAPIIGATIYFITRVSLPLFKTVQIKLEHISLITRETLKGNKVIRSFLKQRDTNQKFKQATASLEEVLDRTNKISSILNPVTYTIINFSIIAVIWLGGIQVNVGKLSQGDIIALVNYLTQILLSLIVLANLIVVFTKAGASAERVLEILDTQPSIYEAELSGLRSSGDETFPIIEFKQVCFSYNNSEKFDVEDISFSVDHGETVGIIGATGSGKSTIVNLIARFYDVMSGGVFVDGIDVREYPMAELRKKIGVVMQQTMLFKGTIKSNLCLGNEKITEQDIVESLTVSEAFDFVNKLPEGYMSKVDTAGKNFSGGQRQRLSIARTIIMDPDILILDDSSSALDFKTELSLRNNIQRLCKEKLKTVIIVSQRISSIKYADKIIVLEDGKMVGYGTHNQLIKECRIYREIQLSQDL